MTDIDVPGKLGIIGETTFSPNYFDNDYYGFYRTGKPFVDIILETEFLQMIIILEKLLEIYTQIIDQTLKIYLMRIIII